VGFRTEFSEMEALKAQIRAAVVRNELDEARRLKLLRLQKAPYNILLYVELASTCLDMTDFSATWEILSQAWQLTPNNYLVLRSMVVYFLRIENFSMAEKTCRLLLEQASHDLAALGMLTHSLIGQGRYEDAIQIGVPVVELSTTVRELPDGMDIFLVKKMADYLCMKKDYAGVVRLWEAGVKCQPGNVNPLLELSQALCLAGDKTQAHQRLIQAQELDPQNGVVSSMLGMDAAAAEQDGTKTT